MLYVVLEIVLHFYYVSCCLWVLSNDAVTPVLYRRVTEQSPLTCRDRLFRIMGLACYCGDYLKGLRKSAKNRGV
jgi:hypothetical protein